MAYTEHAAPAPSMQEGETDDECHPSVLGNVATSPEVEPGRIQTSAQGALRGRRSHVIERNTEFAQRCDLKDLLSGLGEGTERVIVFGGQIAATEWALGALPDGWTADPAGHWLDDTAPALRFIRPDGRKVAVQSAGAWLGQAAAGLAEPAVLERAFDLLREAIRHRWQDPKLGLQGTPVALGRELLQRALPFGQSFEVLNDEVQDFIRATTGQGRIEPAGEDGWAALAARWPNGIPRIEVWDGRFAYAALMRELPVGPVEIVHRGDAHRAWEKDRYRRARWLVRTEVPAGWDHVGILPMPTGDDDRRWAYPNVPGYRFQSWCDGAELLVAHRAGWKIRVDVGMLFATGRPLDRFADRIVGARTTLQCDTSPASKLAQAMLRSVLLQTIGSLHGRAPRRIHATPLHQANTVPGDATDVYVRGAHVIWQRREGRSQRPEMSHPEWTAAIWGRARARLLQAPGCTGALNLTAGSIIALRTDAIWTTDHPRWHDDGQPGRYTHRRTIHGPIPPPRNLAQLLRLATDR